MKYTIICKIFNYISVGIVLFLLLVFCSKALGDSNLLIHAETFTNYQGGFIRRGLDGEILYNISKFFQIPIIQTLKVYSVFTFFLFVVLMIFIKKKYNIPSYILFSMTTLLLYFVYLDRGIRKDHIILSLAIIQSLVLRNFAYKKNVKTIIFVIISLIGTLIHELFFIITFFPNLMVFYINSKNNFQKFIKYSVLLLPSFILFLLLITQFSGNEIQANAIVQSYPNQGYNLGYLVLLFTKSYYFWNQNYHLKNILYFFIFLGLHGLFILISVLNDVKKNSKKSIFIILFILQFLVILLLCMVAIDYSRMVFLSFTTLIIYSYSFKKSELNLPFNFNRFNRIFYSLRYIPFVLYFLLTMPHSGWDGVRGIEKHNLFYLIKQRLYK